MSETIEHLIASGRDAILERERRREAERAERERVNAAIAQAEVEDVLATLRASVPPCVRPYLASAPDVAAALQIARERLDVPVRIPGLAPIWQILHKGAPGMEPPWIVGAVKRIALPRETPTGAEYGEVGIIAHDWPTALAMAADHAAEFTRLARLAAERIERDREIPF